MYKNAKCYRCNIPSSHYVKKEKPPQKEETKKDFIERKQKGPANLTDIQVWLAED